MLYINYISIKLEKTKIMEVSNVLVEKKSTVLSVGNLVSVPDMMLFCSVLLGKMWYNIRVVTIYTSFVSTII